ncbi:MAG: RDD family protein [Planctomycetes bacterium]|nr:RDD family protein [Planctomycetota bacterium]
MPCLHHPDATDGLAPCEACAESFCPSCLAERGGTLYCRECLKDLVACTNHPEATQGVSRCFFCAEPFCSDCLVPLLEGYYCARCKGLRVEDLLAGEDTNPLEYASIGSRVGAVAIDLALLAVPLFLASAVWDFVPIRGAYEDVAFFGLLAGMLLIWLLYEAILLARWGQTLGKMALEIKVLTPRGEEIPLRSALVRAVLRPVVFLVASPILLLVDLSLAQNSDDRASLLDRAARTRVVNWR